MVCARLCIYSIIVTFGCCDVDIAIVNLFRHGEKSNKSGAALTPEGQARANYIARCMSTGEMSRALPFGNPTIVMASANTRHSHRPQDTVSRLANALGLKLDLSCDEQDSQCFATRMQTLGANGTLVAAWHHEALPDLVRSLNVPHTSEFNSWPDICDSTSWPEPPYCSGSSCYDLIWQLRLERDRHTHGVVARRSAWRAVSIEGLHEGFGGPRTGTHGVCAQDLAASKLASSDALMV
eukprot:TRINITY_DN23674_c0_g1_i1.p1 TRINITY_DN23674_c0_g1~~TRINITY_DN23674_c0_g1_i1.p1  ORF type:complete len:238 (+),score=19.26 TRINITY_DN23674_c0_g1_i1:47-760(+)